MIYILFRTLFAALRSHRTLVLENLALRHQLDVLQRNAKTPRLTNRDRVLWVILFRIWADWRRPLIIVQLVTSPAYIVISAADEFRHKTRRVHELWQTDFTWLKVTGWGWYFLSTILDDYSRYIIAWILSATMSSVDVTETLDRAVAKTGVTDVRVRHRPRLLSDNGPAYVSKELQAYLSEKDISHTRGRPYHPQTQGKIERYHRTLKNLVTLQNYYAPWELEREIARFVSWYKTTGRSSFVGSNHWASDRY